MPQRLALLGNGVLGLLLGAHKEDEAAVANPLRPRNYRRF